MKMYIDYTEANEEPWSFITVETKDATRLTNEAFQPDGHFADIDKLSAYLTTLPFHLQFSFSKHVSPENETLILQATHQQAED